MKKRTSDGMIASIVSAGKGAIQKPVHAIGILLVAALISVSILHFDSIHQTSEFERSKENLVGQAVESARLSFAQTQGDYAGYIVELEGTPLAVEAQAREGQPSSLVQSELQSLRQSLQATRDRFTSDATSTLQSNNLLGVSGRLDILAEYDKSIHAVALDITDQQAEVLRTLPGVKKITPNYLYEPSLQDVVPLLEVDTVWHKTMEDLLCNNQNNDCVRGSGVTIGFIDTGIDNSVLDFGMCGGAFDDSSSFVSSGTPTCLSLDQLSDEPDPAQLTEYIIQADQGRLCNSDETGFAGVLPTLLQQRKDAMIALMENSPQDVFDVPPLPSGFASQYGRGLVEERTQFSGLLDVYVNDDFDHANATYDHFMSSGGRYYQLFGNDLPIVTSGASLSFDGLGFDDMVAVNRNDGFSLGVSPTPAEQNIGAENTLVLLATVNGIPPPVTEEEAREKVFQETNDFYVENSYGKTTIVGDVISLSTTTTDACWKDVDIVQLGSSVADLSEYEGIILFSDPFPCEFRPDRSGPLRGRASLGKASYTNPHPLRLSWIHHSLTSIIIHELGHNFGAHHDNTFECAGATGTQPYSENCASREYGSRYSIMGQSFGSLGLGSFSAAHRTELGFLPLSNSEIVTESGSYVLKPIETNSNDLKQLLLPMTVEPSFYFPPDVYFSVEYRQAIGSDSHLPPSSINGVLIRVVQLRNDGIFSSKQQSLLKFENNDLIPLRVGKTFTDNLNGYDVTLDAIDQDGAHVSVTKRDVTPDFTNPVSYFDFDDGSATDKSGFGFDGAVSGATPYASALSFDGVNDHVRVQGVDIASHQKK